MNTSRTRGPRAASPTAATTTIVTPVPAAARSLELARLTVTVSAAAIAACVGLAGIVAVAAPVQARDWLGFTFPGLAARPAVAIGIFAHNLRSLSGVLVLLIFARLAPRAPDKRTARLTVRLGELILAGAIAANLLTVGAALGAFRARMLEALLPHGPVELAAYSLALALYLQDRRHNLPAPYVAMTFAACVALLALATALETFVNL